MIRERLICRYGCCGLGMTFETVRAVRRLSTIMLLASVWIKEDIVFIISLLTVVLSALIEILKLFKDKTYIASRTS